MSKAWVEDAQSLDDSAIRRGEQSILLRTPAVQNFLSQTDLSSHALIAPKGFGKTFVLKVKRLSMQEAGYNCLPHGIIVDRPPGRPPVLPSETADLLSRSGPWESLWQIAFSIAALKASLPPLSQDEINRLITDMDYPPLGKILASDDIATPFEVLHRLLQLQRRGIFRAIESAAVLFSKFSRLKASLAIFIDSIDEYVDYHIKDVSENKEPDIGASLALWHNAQIGAWLALRQLQGLNSKVKIFISLRKESYHFAQSHSLFGNLQAFGTELKYDRENLQDIIDLNIKSDLPLRDSKLSSNELMQAFAGDAIVTSAGTGSTETISDYWLRHCIGRPRDAVKIGRGISEIDDRRRSGFAIRSAINSAAADLVTNIFNESKFHVPTLDPELFARLVPSNVLSRVQLEATSSAYREERATAVAESDGHVFCSLYALGLLGIVVEDQNEPGKYLQRFPSMGRHPLGVSKVLPLAETYLIHPALSDFIAARNATFVGRLHRFNTIGQGRRWREETDYVFVVVGDIESYRTKIMNLPGPASAFPPYWKSTFGKATRRLQHAKASEGDKFVLADGSPVKLLNALQLLSGKLQDSEFGLRLRAGGHSGFWRLSGDMVEPQITEIVGIAARLEPLAEPGGLAVSEKFIKGLEQFENTKLTAAFVGDPEPTVISKPTEPTEQYRLFRYRL
jgi:hypothetical protein